jgi:hypothetical protein
MVTGREVTDDLQAAGQRSWLRRLLMTAVLGVATYAALVLGSAAAEADAPPDSTDLPPVVSTAAPADGTAARGAPAADGGRADPVAVGATRADDVTTQPDGRPPTDRPDPSRSTADASAESGAVVDDSADIAEPAVETARTVAEPAVETARTVAEPVVDAAEDVAEPTAEVVETAVSDTAAPIGATPAPVTSAAPAAITLATEFFEPPVSTARSTVDRTGETVAPTRERAAVGGSMPWTGRTPSAVTAAQPSSVPPVSGVPLHGGQLPSAPHPSAPSGSGAGHAALDAVLAGSPALPATAAEPPTVAVAGPVSGADRDPGFSPD